MVFEGYAVHTPGNRNYNCLRDTCKRKSVRTLSRIYWNLFPSVRFFLFSSPDVCLCVVACMSAVRDTHSGSRDPGDPDDRAAPP